jgi:[ribosomal protein S5]-alanine N-acetyltransferase
VNPPESFTTDRLLLHRPKLGDAPSIFQNYAQDSEVTRYVLWRPHKGIEETESFLKYLIEKWNSATEFAWTIRFKNQSDVIGMISFRPNGHKVEIGYVLAKKHWGTGIMTETLQTIVSWLLTQKEIYRVWAVCDIDNIGSSRVMEKAGMDREGILRRWVVHPNVSPEPRDSLCYSIISN